MLGRRWRWTGRLPNPRIVIVTDRDDLDKQIKGTFKACDLEPVRATSGSDLLQLIQNKTPLITTIVNKFDTALRYAQYRTRTPTSLYSWMKAIARRPASLAATASSQQDAAAAAQGLLPGLYGHASAQGGEKDTGQLLGA